MKIEKLKDKQTVGTGAEMSAYGANRKACCTMTGALKFGPPRPDTTTTLAPLDHL